MRLNSKLTWGLAWAGLALVIAVPSLDAFSGNSAAPAVITSDTNQVKVASATSSEEPKTTTTPAATTNTPKPGSITINPDGTVVRSNSTSTTPAATATALATESPPPATTETKVAAAEQPAPPLVAPIPAPASARPKSQPVVAALPPPATTTAPPVAQTNQPLIIEDTDSASTDEYDDPNDLIPPEDIPDDDPAALRAYLEARGLLEPYDGRSTASVQYIDAPAQDEEASGDYDADGFYLSDGPNSERRTTRRSARSGWFYDEYGNLIFR